MPNKPFVDTVREVRDGLTFLVYIVYPLYGTTVKYRYTVYRSDGYIVQDREFRYNDIRREITGNAAVQPVTVS